MHEIGARCAFVAHLRLMHESGPLGFGGCAAWRVTIKWLNMKWDSSASASEGSVPDFVVDLWGLDFGDGNGFWGGVEWFEPWL